MEQFKPVKLLGRGSFGSVWLTLNKNVKCVVKEISIPAMKLKEKESAINEVRILSTLKHKNIIRYQDAFIHNKNLCIAMEYADDGDLALKIKNQNGKLFMELQIIDWFAQILIAVKYIHSLNILHRDIKSQNVFLSKNNIVKVGDFGVSRFLDDALYQARTAIGTPFYLSPEICKQKPYNNKTDMWSLGVLLYELTTLNHPFQGDDFPALVVKIIRGKYRPISSCYGPLLHDMLLVLLQVKPEDRPTASQLLKVPLLRPHVRSYLMRVKHRDEENDVIIDVSFSKSRLHSERVPANVDDDGKRTRSETTSRKFSKASKFSHVVALRKPHFHKMEKCISKIPKYIMESVHDNETPLKAVKNRRRSLPMVIQGKKTTKQRRSLESLCPIVQKTTEDFKVDIDRLLNGRKVKESEEVSKKLPYVKANSPKVNFIERNRILAFNVRKAASKKVDREVAQNTDKREPAYSIGRENLNAMKSGLKRKVKEPYVYSAKRFVDTKTTRNTPDVDTKTMRNTPDVDTKTMRNTPDVDTKTTRNTPAVEKRPPNTQSHVDTDVQFPSVRETTASLLNKAAVNVAVKQTTCGKFPSGKLAFDVKVDANNIEITDTANQETSVIRRRSSFVFPDGFQLASNVKERLKKCLQSTEEEAMKSEKIKALKRTSASWLVDYKEFTVSEPQLHSTLKDEPLGPSSKTDKKLLQMTYSLPNSPSKHQEDTIHLDHTATYIKASVHSHVRSYLMKALGKDKLKAAVQIVRVMQSSKEWEKIRETLGDENLVHLPALLEIARQEFSVSLT